MLGCTKIKISLHTVHCSDVKEESFKNIQHENTVTKRLFLYCNKKRRDAVLWSRGPLQFFIQAKDKYTD